MIRWSDDERPVSGQWHPRHLASRSLGTKTRECPLSPDHYHHHHHYWQWHLKGGQRWWWRGHNVTQEWRWRWWLRIRQLNMTHSARANLFQGSHSYLSTIMPEKSNHDHHDHCGGYYSWHLIVKIRPRIGTCLLRSMITLMSEVFEQSLKASLWLSLLIILYLQLGRLNPFFLFNSHCKACLANWRWILFLCNLLCGGRGIYSWRWCHHFAQPGSILLMLLAEYSNSNVAQSSLSWMLHFAEHKRTTSITCVLSSTSIFPHHPNMSC